MLLAFLFLLLLASLVALVYAVQTLVHLLRFRVPYVATPQWAIAHVAELAGRAHDVADIGCGDARVLRAIEKKNTGATLTGYEAQWWPYVGARWRTWRAKSRVEVTHQNFWAIDLERHDFIFCYLLSDLMPKLEEKLRRELKPGARVASYGFTFPAWPPAEVITNPAKPQGSALHIYEQR